MGKKAEQYKNLALVEQYREMTRKVGVLCRIAVRQLLGTRPEGDARTEYMTARDMQIEVMLAQQEAILELALTKLGVDREDFLKAMTENMAKAVKAKEEDFGVTSWDDTGNPIFDLAKYAARTNLWPR